MQKTSMIFLVLSLYLALLGGYLSFFNTTPETLFIRFFGLAALSFVTVTLAIGPLVVLFPSRFAPLIEPRRAIGLAGFTFMITHFLLILVHVYGGDWALSFASLNTLIAVPAVGVFTLLALTSSDYAMRTLGGRWWKRVQQLNYLAFLLIVGHYYLSQKGTIVILPEGNVFINLAELGVWILVTSVVLLQAIGFITRKKKQHDAALAAAATTKESSNPPV